MEKNNPPAPTLSSFNRFAVSLFLIAIFLSLLCKPASCSPASVVVADKKPAATNKGPFSFLRLYRHLFSPKRTAKTKRPGRGYFRRSYRSGISKERRNALNYRPTHPSPASELTKMPAGLPPPLKIPQVFDIELISGKENHNDLQKSFFKTLENDLTLLNKQLDRFPGREKGTDAELERDMILAQRLAKEIIIEYEDLKEDLEEKREEFSNMTPLENIQLVNLFGSLGNLGEEDEGRLYRLT